MDGEQNLCRQGGIEMRGPQITRPQAYRYGLEPVTSLGTVSTAPSNNLDGNAGKRVGEAALSIQQSALSCHPRDWLNADC